MHLTQRNIHYQKSGIIRTQEKMRAFQEYGKKNINTGHLLTELITHMVIETLFVLAHQLGNIPKKSNKS